MRFMITKYCYTIFILTFILVGCSKTISTDTLPGKAKTANLYIPGAYKIYCLNPETGVKRWEFTTVAAAPTDMVVDEIKNIGYFGDAEELVALDLLTGKEKWRKLAGGNILHAPVFDKDKRLFYATKLPYSFGCFHLDSLKMIWTRILNKAEFESAPILAKGCVYITYKEDNNKNIICVRQDSGLNVNLYPNIIPSRFSNPFKYSSVNTNGALGNPYFLNDKIYVNLDNKVYCLNDSLKNIGASTSPVSWSYSNPNKSYSGSPLIYGGMCLIGGADKYIHCIDIVAGVTTARWKVITGEAILGSGGLDKANENMLMGSADNFLYCINHITGQIRWKFPTTNMIIASPMVYNNKVYFTSIDKNLYCLNAVDGTLLWKYNINSQNKTSPVIQTESGLCLYPTESGSSAN